MIAPARARFSYEEYLDLEEAGPIKHEFLDGVVYAMSGGSPEHAAVCANVARRVDLWRRTKRGWTQLVAREGESIELDSLDCALSVDAIYFDPLA